MSAAPGAVLGSWSVGILPADWLLGFLSLFLAVSSVAIWRLKPREGNVAPKRFPLKPATILCVGLVAGFGSALTGTGEPVITLPILSVLRTPMLVALGLSQASQLPIASAAIVAHAYLGHLDAGLFVAVAVGLCIGVTLGAKVSRFLPELLLRRLIALVVMLASLAMMFRLAQGT